MRVGLVYTLMRKEEILIREALERKGVEVLKIDDKRSTLSLAEDFSPSVDAVLIRSISLTHALVWAKYFEQQGVCTVNGFSTLDTCGNKYLTTLALLKNKVPTPNVTLALDPESALETIEKIGYPCVVKPLVGSWGRLVAKINDRESAEALIEHKEAMKGLYNGVFYIQEYIEKPGRDIRVLVIGDEAAGAIYRKSEGWKTNTALGGIPEHCPLTPPLKKLAVAAAHAVGGGIVTIDVFETKDGLVVNEVNGVAEFGKSLDAYGVPIPEKIAHYILHHKKKVFKK